MSESGDVFNVERLRELVELMEQHDLRELELRQGEQQIQLKRGMDVPNVVATPAAPPAPASSPPAGGPSSPPATETEDEGKFTYIESPMVGTFYSKPNPDSETFVKVGDRVNPDTTVCIIEAMKVFNEIAAECSGTVAAVLVDNEEPVEFGKQLFKIDTSG